MLYNQVSTIDAFQGDQNDVIIVSLVRCNAQGNIGFLAEKSRRCVAQSRARCAMIMIGSAATLEHPQNSPWRSLLKGLRSRGLVSDSLAVFPLLRNMELSSSRGAVQVPDADALEQLLEDSKSGYKTLSRAGYKPPSQIVRDSHRQRNLQEITESMETLRLSTLEDWLLF